MPREAIGPERVLEFWFGPLDGDRVPPEKNALWWAKDEAIDASIREEFGELLERATRGEISTWEDAPRTCLALIVVLDQFSRNIHRGTRRAFAQDALALDVSRRGLDRGMDFSLRPIERMFFYMPMMHAEDRAIQKKSVALFEELARQVSPSAAKDFERCRDFAIRHRDIVERFGRFPHRNRILGRTSTPAEEAFLLEPASSF